MLPRSRPLAVLGSQVYKEHSLWQNRAYRSPGTTPNVSPTSCNRHLYFQVLTWRMKCYPELVSMLHADGELESVPSVRVADPEATQ
jgi:hypothetical protein